MDLPTQVVFDNTGAITTTNGSGAFVLAGGGFTFDGVSQYGRLGSNALTISDAQNARKNLTFNDTASGTFSNNITFTGGLVGNNTSLNLLWGNSSSATGTSVTFTGTLSGPIQGGWVNGVGFISPQFYAVPVCDDRYNVVFQGDGSGLYSLNAANQYTGHIHIVSGPTILNSPNALGTGNNLSFFVGNNATSTTNVLAGLLATNGNNVSGPVLVNAVENGGDQHNPVVELGLSGTGSVTFSGIIQLEEYTGSDNQNQRVRLVSPAGSTVNFTGAIQGASPGNAYAYVPITILGGGTVNLSGTNTYGGQTNVREGTLVLSGSSPTGGGTISLGDTVVAPSGGDVACATTSELLNGQWWNWSYSAGTLTFSSAITSIDGVSLSPGNRILYKDAVNPAWTGVYTYVDSTHWTLATDLNTAAAYITRPARPRPDMGPPTEARTSTLPKDWSRQSITNRDAWQHRRRRYQCPVRV